MKKVIALVTVVLCCSMTALFAQGGGGGQQMTPEQRMERMKQMYKAPLVEKAKITEAQADKVLDVLAEFQPKTGAIMRDQAMSAEDRVKKMEELNGERDKKLKASGLSDDQVKAVVATLDEIRKNRPRPGGGGGGK